MGRGDGFRCGDACHGVRRCTDAVRLPLWPHLKVVSRYEGWVEVADPKSGATGWMQAGMLGPARANRDPYGQNEAYYDDPPRRRVTGFAAAATSFPT